MDQILERLAGNEYYCFLDGFSGYFQIHIEPRDQEKTTFTCPYRTFTYRRMPFGLYNAPGTFQRCEDTNLSLNWEKSHFMVKEGIVLGHKISKNGIEGDKAKVNVIAKLPHPTTVKDCIKAFQTLKTKLTEAPILIVPNWDLPFELMCDASDFAIGDHRKVQLNELNELCDHAYENSLIYKEKTKRIYDSKIKNCVFNVGDQVLFFNSRLKIFSGKLKTRWSGPFTIAKVFPYCTVELSQANGPNFKVNGHRVKHYFGGDVPQLIVPDRQTIPMDN
uniref:Reverse transcriptase domain-containing protein n=1 Tax=Tanacetum cinerariifolium TaxID=118510 RepID=A0A699JXU8_TANCI|nr:reverse transcriptase domain-containing protein [Tanacetum cinerariifolium]